MSEPRTILHDLFSSTKIELHELDRLPHDLWPAQQLPPLALIDRAILVLYGFDLKLQIDADGKSCQLVPIERPWMIRQRTPVAAKRRPAAKQSDHKDGPASRSAQKVYSLRIREKSVGNVLRQLAKQLHLELQWDEKKLAVAGRTLDRRISCEVDSATLDQLLESVLTPAGLQYKREGTVVRIEAAE